MTCPPKLLPLQCDQSGIGYTAANYNCGSTTLRMAPGFSDDFPTPSSGRFFYVELETKCSEKHDCGRCCATLKVVNIVNNEWTVEPVGDCNCECFSANARVIYSTSTYEAVKAVIEQIGIKVQPPLKYDCETGTLSLDCNYLNKCGCPECI